MSENENGKSNDRAGDSNAGHNSGGSSNGIDRRSSDESVADAVTEMTAEQMARTEAEKLRNDYLYLRAEFENYKKHVIKERADLRKYGSERLLAELLSVLDIFETALDTDHTPENAVTFRKGVELTANSLRSTLGRFGVEEIPADAVAFDPAVHEALSSEETDRVPPGYVSKVFKKPYKLHDRVIRPGQVIVAKAKA